MPSGPGLLKAVAGSGDLTKALGVAVRELCDRTGWPVGHALLLSDLEGREAPRNCGCVWYLEEEKRFAAFRLATERRDDRLRRGVEKTDDWLARVIASGSPVWSHSLAGLASGRRKAAARAGLKAGCAFPVLAEGKPVAAVELLRPDAEEVPEAIREQVASVSRILDLMASCDRARRAVRVAALKVRGLKEERERKAEATPSGDEGYALIRQVANDGLWEWDPRADHARFSPRWREIFGLSKVRLEEGISEWIDRVHPEDRERVALELQEYLEGGGERFESRHRVLHTDGKHRWVMVRALALRDEGGKVVRVAGSLTDISDLKMLDERASQELLYHPVTGFPRAPLFADRLRHAVNRRSRRPEASVAVVAVELEGLEGTTRGLGSQAREELVLSVSRRLSGVLRPGDSVGHAADFPFAVLLEEVDGEGGALRVAERIHKALGRTFPLEEGDVRLVPHVGVALFHPGYEKPETLLLDAALALRRAHKRAVGVQLFDEDARAAAGAATELEGDLRAAFSRDEFFLEYQPIVSLDDGRITGLETLLRWRHPHKGLISPEHFLPVAEESGLIEEIGYWVLNRACRQMKEWDERLSLDFPPTLAVNISERQFYDPSLISTTTGILKGTGLEFSRLRFDVAEDIFMKDPARATQILTALKARGIRVAIDDFGSGYSSISLLHRFSVSSLKIDRWFISGETAKLREWDVAQTIIELAKILGLEVIAEGVESREQFHQLRSLGCQQAQGFFFSGAVLPGEAEALIREGYPMDLGAPAH
ncbi:MAG: putative bifunctional diguanylate cyclase/phosphodiesterase [Gemmatimonadota bacterium]